MSHIILKQDTTFDLYAHSKNNEGIFSKFVTVPFINCYRFHSIFEDDFFLHGLCETQSNDYTFTYYCGIHSFYSRFGMVTTKIEFDPNLTKKTKLAEKLGLEFHCVDIKPSRYPESLTGFHQHNLDKVSITLEKGTWIEIDSSTVSLDNNPGIEWRILEHSNFRLNGEKFFTPIDNLVKIKKLSTTVAYLSISFGRYFLPKKISF